MIKSIDVKFYERMDRQTLLVVKFLIFCMYRTNIGQTEN